jgi:[acyl-carrier-protein] S-malonyltransferase
MGLALLFSGQGGQHPGMLPWLLGASPPPALDALDRHLGPAWRTRLGDPGWLYANAVAQPLLTALGIAAWSAIADRLPKADVVAGYSVGELGAYAAAGVLDAADAVDLACVRAAAMDGCVAGQDTGLMSVQGPQALDVATASPSLSLAIRISEDRVIVGGPVATLAEAGARWSAQGLRCARLPVGLASHTPAMEAAAARVAAQLAGLALRPPRTTVVCNFTGSGSRSLPALAAALSGQIASTVLWDDCMDSIAERRVTCVLEVGPGAALASMWRERHPHIPARSVDEFQHLDGVVSWARRQLA